MAEYHRGLYNHHRNSLVRKGVMYYIAVILSVFAAACAQMLLKQGARQNYTPWWRQYVNGYVIGGYSVMLVAMAVNIFAMSRGVMVKEVSIIESLSYLFVPVLSFCFFRERITWRKVCAIAVIMIGVIIFFV